MENLDFKLNRESLAAAAVILDCSCEQPVEKDIVLPDYYPDIFRVLKCTVSPFVNSHSINGGKLSFETAVTIRVLYLAENDKRINCIEQKCTLPKSLDLNGECVNPAVYVIPKCDYINCRVVNQRRLDIRGAVTASVKVVSDAEQAVVTDASGCCVQLKKQPATFPSKRISVAKRITVIEELEMSSSKPSVGTVLRCGCSVNQGENKIIAGKLITKGEAEITMLYSCINSAGEDTAENMKFSVPFSQIIDVDGIDETYEAQLEITAGSCDIIPKGEESSSLECELVLLVTCTAVKYETGEVVTDAYSTKYECELEHCKTAVECRPAQVNESFQSECTLTCGDGEISCIYDSFAECRNVSVRADKDKNCFVVSGSTLFSVLGANGDKQPFFIEGETPFEQEIPLPAGCNDIESASCDVKVSAAGCSFYLAGAGSAEMKAELKICGYIRFSSAGCMLGSLKVLTDKPKQKNNSYALKLCRCADSEDIWDIAKRYSTSVTAIMEENELTDDKISQQGMLLIPLMS